MKKENQDWKKENQDWRLVSYNGHLNGKTFKLFQTIKTTMNIVSFVGKKLQICK